MDKDSLREEFEYYKSHQSELVKEYDGKFVGIRGEEVFGPFDSRERAIRELSKRFELGTFLVQLVGKGTDNYTQVFHTRVGYATKV